MWIKYFAGIVIEKGISRAWMWLRCRALETIYPLQLSAYRVEQIDGDWVILRNKKTKELRRIHLHQDLK